ncbi:NACHT, LRR and PYD domains-containing protein 1 homolog [Clupea harengus]|uniref:NACHT, LRR and PYD domains-containing protein 1 homolog n=1 Tax=Clupea harengus TaxID=7950 RepID=A0A8M1KB03_CLUHA|nr:NACHT, LRR and PYD domains-containing protein 1 homolog [Clupea harengus]
MFLFFKVSNHFFIFFWSPKRLDISGGEMIYHHYGQRCCNSCADITESSHWVLMEPSVSMETGVPVYKHRSPPGSFECAVSGLRWVCTGEVTLQYHFSDPDVFRAEVAMLQYTPISSLMDIKVLSGELLEAHLPHFACLDGSTSSLSDAVRVLRGADTGITLETCELTRFHAKLLKPSFSLTEVLVKIGVPVKSHLDVLIYRTRVTPLTLLTYVVPRDASMIQAVEEDIREIQDAKKLKKHRPDMSIWMNTKFSLTSSCPADVSPPEITLKYIRPPDLFQVFIENADHCFDLELISEGQSIWKATIQSVEYGETGEVARSHKMSAAASRHSRGVFHRDASYTSKAARADEEEGKMATTSNKDQLFMIRPDLIKRISGSVLRDLLDGLQGHQAPVLSGREAEEILQSTRVLRDQVTSLIDIVYRKGEKACDIMLSMLEELDNYLYRDLVP